MKAFIINLDSAHERKITMIAQCDRYGLDYQITEAVNGKALPQEVISAVTADYPTCALTRGEIGCTLSHLNIYSAVIREKLECALILEDDAVITEEITQWLSAIEKSISRTRPEIYILSGIDAYNKWITKSISDRLTCYRMINGSRSHGYIINKPAAEALIRTNLPVRFEADRWPLFRDICGVSVWCLEKEIIGTSDIDKNGSVLNSERIVYARQRGEHLRQLKKSYKGYQLKRIKNVLVNKIGKREISPSSL